jgi:hypothetical protein
MATLDLTKRAVKGSPISTTEHDQNLTDIETQVNENTVDIGDMGVLGPLAGRMVQAESDITTLETGQGTNDTELADHETRVTANEVHAALTAGNPHAIDNSDVGLGNVTNHSQMKRAAGDIVTFTAKTTPIDADVTLIEDSAASNAKKRVTWANIKATLKTYFDTLYSTLSHAARHTDGNDDIQSATNAQKGLATAAQITKLEGVETAATIDQTGAEIKTLYEAEANAFTDAKNTKLTGVETSADVTDAANVNTAGAVMEADFDAKGDILIASADNTPTKLILGTNTHVLTADSAQTTGVKWSAAGTGDVTAAANLGDNKLVRGNGGTKGVQECTMLVSDAGEMTNPSQPCFQAYITAQQNNVTGDDTLYNITGAIWTERFDVGNNLLNGIFTAPVTGKYTLTGLVSFLGISNAHTQVEIRITTSNYVHYISDTKADGVAAATGVLKMGGSITVDMDANDTAYIRTTVFGTSKIVDIYTSTWFAGALLC